MNFRLCSMIVLLAAICADLQAGDPTSGRALVKSWECDQCHGLSGNNRSSEAFPTPMLAGQPAAFLMTRMKQYKAGLFGTPLDIERMIAALKTMSDADMADIAAHYESQKRY